MENKSTKNGGGKRKHLWVPCISKELYDEAPQSDFVILQMFFNLLHTSFIVLSKFRLGQLIISILDYYMIKIENTLDFCLPDNCEYSAQRVIDKHKRTLPIQDRPMSWLFFIPALIFLRIFRFTLSIYCIMAGWGEVTAQQMQSKVIAFRRYYRSIRHYAVKQRTEEEERTVISRKGWIFWRVYFRIYESIFMTRPLVEKHFASGLNGDMAEKGRSMRREKRALEMSSSEDDLNTNEMLDKYANIDDSLSVDPDYEPDENKTLNETAESTEMSDDENEEEIIQKEVNAVSTESGEQSVKTVENQTTEEKDDKSNKENLLTPTQMRELESDITMKILNYFKENYNAPSNINFSGEVFYSPIGSPPENASESQATETSESDGKTEKVEENHHHESQQ